MSLLLLLVACDRPDDCADGTTWSPMFGQCVGVEAAPTTTPEPPGTPTGDTGADSASTG